MQYGFYGLDKVALGVGVCRGMLVSGETTATVTVAPGVARVGSLDGDPGATNKAEQGMNQPGKLKEIKTAMTDSVAALANGVYLLWLKTDSTLALVLDPLSILPTPGVSDPADLSPEYGNNPFKGEMIDGRVPGGTGQQKLQEGPLRRAPVASCLLAKVTVAAGIATTVDNTAASMQMY